MKKTWILLIITLSVFFTLISCEDEPSEVGVSLQPGSDKIVVATDTLSVETHTRRDSSIATDERTISLLGSVSEPDFGITTAGFITQTRLSSTDVEEDVEIQVDSLELVLDYSNYYGDTSSNISFSLYQIVNTDFHVDSAYYSDYTPDESAGNLNLLGEYEIEVRPSDTLLYLTISDEDFLSLFENKSIYNSNEDFLDVFKGFYLKADDQTSNGGCIAYFNLVSDNSRLIMHYNEEDTYDFLINYNSVRINLFDHDYSTAAGELQSALTDTDNEEISFIHSGAGLTTEVRIKDTARLNELADKGINKAQLQVKIHPDFFNDYGNPEQMTIVYENDMGLFEFLTDYKVSSSHFGGEITASGEYIFNIPFYLQDLIANDGSIQLDNSLFMFGLNNRTDVSHCAIYGGNHPDNPLQILIVNSDY